MRRAYRSLFLVAVATLGVVLLALSNMLVPLVPALAATATALIMGGRGTPDPGEQYVNGQTTNYVLPTFGPIPAVGIHTTEDFWPVTGLDSLTFDESVVKGVADLDVAIAEHPNQSLVILGYSESTRVATIKKRQLIEANGDDFSAYPDISFVLVSDVNKGNGGIQQRFAGWSIPILGVTFDGAIPTDSPANPNDPTDHALDTVDITYVHDGFSDFPIYPTNVLALANALAGIAYLHGAYPNLEEPTLIPVGHNGDTDYYVIDNDIVPILRPLQTIGVPRPILLVLDAPTRVMIEDGYRRDINPGEPTPAYLIPVTNPVSLTVNLAKSVPVGIDDATEDMGLGRTLGTTKPGPYGVGGEDEDLEGLPAGFIPLGQTSSGTSTTTLAPTNRGAALDVTMTPEPATEDSADGDAKPVERDDAKLAEGDDDVEKPSTPPADRPKPQRPKVRGPIEFDLPKLPATRPAGDRPLRRLVTALTGRRPDPTVKPDEPTKDETSDEGAA